MGKWNRRNYSRPRYRKYQDYQWSPPRDEPCPDPETETWQDNVPMWEKKFCYLVGRMPWKKVLSTKNFMNCNSQSNVLRWDDSAGKEAFLTAKKRFWDELNGLPCDTHLPNPDMYIDEIDWNPYIDPELAKECDKEYFDPDNKYCLPSTLRKETLGWPKDVDDSWEHGNMQSCKVENKAPGWGQWDTSVDDPSTSNKDGDPWESHHIHKNEAVNDKATCWNQWDNSVTDVSQLKTKNDPWEKHLNTNDDPWENHNVQGNVVAKDNSWGGERNKFWDVKPNEYSYMPNNWSTDGNSWRKEGSGWRDQRASSKAWNEEAREVRFTSYWHENNRNRQEYSSHRGGRGNQWGQKPRVKNNWGPKDSTNIHRGQGQLNAGCRKREGPDYYVANSKGPRLQEDWNGGNNKRFSFGGQ